MYSSSFQQFYSIRDTMHGETLFRFVLKHSRRYMCRENSFCQIFHGPRARCTVDGKILWARDVGYNPVENFFCRLNPCVIVRRYFHNCSIVEFWWNYPGSSRTFYTVILIIPSMPVDVCVRNFPLRVRMYVSCLLYDSSRPSVPFGLFTLACVTLCESLRRGVTGCHSQGVRTTRACHTIFHLTILHVFSLLLPTYRSFQSVALIGQEEITVLREKRNIS